MYPAFLCNTFIRSSIIESENEEDYDSEDILGLKSVQESHADSADGPGWRFSRYICGSSDREVWHELNNLIGLEPVKRHLSPQ
jgi:hypothetical protein